LNSLKAYISLFFAIVLAFGMTLSAIHMHVDDFTDVQTEHILVEVEFQCNICGSLVKFTPDDQSFTFLQDSPEIYFFSSPVQSAISPFGIFQDGRAPPLFS
jgi:hypothetical protein